MVGKDKIFSWIFYLLIVVLLMPFALQKVHDPDVWLHLGIGKYMVEHRALPAGDIFTYTGFGKPYEYFEWLFEVFLYLLYQAFGYDGLMVCKLGLWLLTMGLLWQWMKTEGVESRWAALFALFPAYWLGRRWQERPEVMGYFFLVFYLWAWSQYRHRGRNYLYFLPLVQIIWINLHPSALLGVVVFLVILLGEGLDYFWNKAERDFRVIKALAMMIPLLLIVSFLNPYGYKSVIIPILYSTEKVYKELILEWKPIWNFGFIHKIYLYFLVPAALSFILRYRRSGERLKMAELFLFIWGAALPYVSSRYATVFAVVSLPLAGKNYYRWFSGFTFSEQARKKWQPRTSGALLAAALLLCGLLLGVFSKRVFWGWGADKFMLPEKATAFIQSYSVPGPIFNNYPWGGYLILQTHPGRLVFIDSRAFEVEVFKEYLSILYAKDDWEKKLELRGVNLIMVNSLSFADGSLFPLVMQLVSNPDWVLIGNEENTLIFLKNRPPNQKWIQNFALPKSLIFDEIISEGRTMIKKFDTTGQIYKSLGWAYLMKGNFPEAKAAYHRHLQLNPGDEAVRNYLSR